MKLIDELNAVAVKISDLEQRLADSERKLREADAGMWIFADDLIAANKRAEIAEAARDGLYKESMAFFERAQSAERRLATIAAALAGKIAAPVEIVAEATADVCTAPNLAKSVFEYTDDHQAILKGLTCEFQTVLELHKSAKAHGFSKGDQTVRNYMVRDIMPFGERRGTIEQRDKLLAWKLTDKPKGDKPDTVAPVSVDAGLADLKAAIEKVNGSKIGDDFKAPEAKAAPVVKVVAATAKDIARDTILLKALGDDPEGRSYLEWEIAILKKGGAEFHAVQSPKLERDRARLHNLNLLRRVKGVTGRGREPRFTAYPTLAEALAKLKGGK